MPTCKQQVLYIYHSVYTTIIRLHSTPIKYTCTILSTKPPPSSVYLPCTCTHVCTNRPLNDCCHQKEPAAADAAPASLPPHHSSTPPPAALLRRLFVRREQDGRTQPGARLCPHTLSLRNSESTSPSVVHLNDYIYSTMHATSSIIYCNELG